MEKEPKIYLVSYADGEIYEKAQRIKNEFGRQEGFDGIFAWNKGDLVMDGFWRKNAHILEPELNGGVRNGGCAWKAYVMLESMKMIEEGDILLYSDVGDLINSGIKDFTIEQINKNDGFMLVENTHSNRAYTRTGTFIIMDCFQSKYLMAKQLEAGLIGIKKEQKTMRFLEEWNYWNQQEDVVLNKDLGYNDSECIRGSCDQSILTLIGLKWDLKFTSIWDILNRGLVQYNCFC